MDGMKWDELCAAVFDLEPRIRSVRVINKRGHSEAGGMRVGVEPLEKPEHNEMMFMELMLRVRMRHDFDAQFGDVEYALSYRQKVIFISFPIGEGAMVISCEKSVDCMALPLSILEIIRRMKG